MSLFSSERDQDFDLVLGLVALFLCLVTLPGYLSKIRIKLLVLYKQTSSQEKLAPC